MVAPQPRPTPEMLAAAQSPNVRDRLALAARRDIPRELLFFLAADLAPAVRRLVAQNPENPLEADRLLAEDGEDAVRDGLIEKTVGRIPGNEEEGPNDLHGLLVDILELLARDPSEAIRVSLSEAVADLRHAPHSAIRALAEDERPEVAIPVLRRSPVLDATDLVAVARRAASDLHLGAIAARPNLPASAAHAIVELERDGAVRTLLRNPSVQLRESTLDRLLERSADHPGWLPLLAENPHIGGGSAERLARIIADSLKDGLALGQTDREKLAQWAAALAGERIERAHAEEDGKADETALLGLIERGDLARLCTLIAERAGLPEESVSDILAAAAPRGVVALAWAAGFTMAFALTLQSQVARIMPEAMLQPAPDGGYPLSQDELASQLAFFGAAARGPLSPSASPERRS